MADRCENAGLLPHIADAEGFGAAFKVSRETLDRLTVYANLLAKWQQTINLVAPGTLNDVWHRHFADSAQVLALAGNEAGQVWVDLGCGAGFPGLVLAILRAEAGEGRAILVESDSRKCAFLAEVARKTGVSAALTVEIVNQRIENPATRARLGPIDVLTARALAPLDRLLGLCQPLVQPQTRAFFLKGRSADDELVTAREMWAFEARVWPSRTDVGGHIVEVSGLRPREKGDKP